MQRGRDSNPRYGYAAYTLSRRAPSTTRPPLSIVGQITKNILVFEIYLGIFRTFPLLFLFQTFF